MVAGIIAAVVYFLGLLFTTAVESRRFDGELPEYMERDRMYFTIILWPIALPLRLAWGFGKPKPPSLPAPTVPLVEYRQ